MKKIIIMTALVIGMLSHAVIADVPRTINYQGRLTDNSGNPVVDGSYSVAIRLYGTVDALESASIWSDTYSVETKSGYFNVVLGSNPSYPLNLSFDQQYWIGLKVGTDVEMTPRQALNSVPYALNVATAAYPGYMLSNIITLTAGTPSYSPSAGVKAILVECVGAGGGGGGAAYGSSLYGAAGGGGAGGYARKWIVSPSASYAVTIGTGGAGGSAGANPGIGGGETTFGAPAIITCTGGSGSQAGAPMAGPTNSSNGGTGGVASGGDLNVDGADGYTGVVLGQVGVISGYGGSSNFGKGGSYQVQGGTGFNGENASGYGSGGSGGCAIPSTNRSGGDGSDGVIFIWEYK